MHALLLHALLHLLDLATRHCFHQDDLRLLRASLSYFKGSESITITERQILSGLRITKLLELFGFNIQLPTLADSPCPDSDIAEANSWIHRLTIPARPADMTNSIKYV